MAKKGFFASLFGGGGKRSGGSRASKGRATSSKSKARSSASKRTSSKVKTTSQAKRSTTKVPAQAKRQTKAPSKTSTTKNKNVSKRYPNGRTLKTKDKYLPIVKDKKSDNPKDERWVAIIDSNRKDELAVVRLTKQNQPNTTHLPTYKKGNGQRSFFKHFVEIVDDAGDPIKVDGRKFQENPREFDLNAEQLATVKSKVIDHCRQSSENKKKIADLKKNGDSQR